MRILTAYFLILSFVPRVPAQPASGTICVIPNSVERPKVVSPGDDYNPATLMIKIDKRAAIPWPHKEIAKIQALDLNERHLVIVISDGKRIKSFWIRFSDFKTPHLCVSFDGYQGVDLGDSSSRNCKCS